MLPILSLCAPYTAAVRSPRTRECRRCAPRTRAFNRRIFCGTMHRIPVSHGKIRLVPGTARQHRARQRTAIDHVVGGPRRLADNGQAMLAHTPTATELPPPLAGWCREVLGPYTVASTHSQAHRESQVWRLVTGDEAVYLKAHRRYAKWAMEVHAYEQWAPALGDQAPRLIATREDPFQAILTTALPGAPLERAALPAGREFSAWHAAGAALARLHSLPANQWFGSPARNGQPQATLPEDDPIALVGTSLEYRLTRGVTGGLLDTHEIAVVQRALDAVEVFAGERPTPCHGDYLPRNWIVDAAGMWRGMIDFEHARWDLRMNDLGYWWDRNFSERSDLAAAFLAGYGGSLDEREHTQLYVIRVLCAVGRVIWGHERGDVATRELGHTTLERLVLEKRSE